MVWIEFDPVSGSCSTTWLRPERFATSRASSARRRTAASSSPGSISVIPKLHVNLGSPPTVMAASSWVCTVVQGPGRVDRRAVREGDGELLAAVAGNEVVRPQRVAQDAGEEPQGPVAGLVPVGVVQVLEVVEVGHGDRDRMEAVRQPPPPSRRRSAG